MPTSSLHVIAAIQLQYNYCCHEGDNNSTDVFALQIRSQRHFVLVRVQPDSPNNS
jgi:hypothetical protein